MNPQAPKWHRYLYVVWASIGVLALAALVKYPGQALVYILFTVLANALLYFGFRSSAIFFDTFIGIFFWLAFWLKLTVRVAFFDGQFNQPVGHFDGSAAAFDRALLAASGGFAGLLAASALRARFFTYPALLAERSADGLFAFYARHRRAVLLAFVGLVVAVAASNLYLGIYQRGSLPRTVLPYGLNGVYSWLLLFGLASFSAVILHLEFRLKQEISYTALAASLLEGFLSNVSLLSRGMLLNTGALGYGLLRTLKPDQIRTRFRSWVTAFVAFAVLFACSVVLVTYVRAHLWNPAPDFTQTTGVTGLVTRVTGLIARVGGLPFLDRWVGMEGLMAVSSHPGQDWDLWREAWKEVQAQKLSFYDTNFIASPYLNIDLTKHHFISLPGIVAFFFYPGSFTFLAACMFILGLLAAAIEFSVFKLGGKNLILCALLAQVIASRYVHFGYVPRQSYLLFGALYLNVFLLYFADRALAYWQRKSRG